MIQIPTPRTFIVSTVAALIWSIGTAHAQESAAAPAIDAVQVDHEASLVLIFGRHFGTAPEVVLGQQTLEIIDADDSAIRARLPGGLPAGTYRLRVSRPVADQVEVTIGPRAGQRCPEGQFVTGFDADGNLLCAAGGGSTDPCDGEPPPGAEMEWAMTCAHNRVRTTATPAPSPPLPPMEWSEELAAIAQTWAEGCEQGHNPDRGPVGENLAWTSRRDSPQQVVDLWAAEAEDYDHADNACSGNTCGHYLQLVTRTATELGCGKASCALRTFWVCNYRSGVYGNRRPY